MTAPIYTARFPLPDLLERGRAQELLCPVYYDGELVEPTAAAVQVYTPSGDVAVSGAGTVVDRVATYEVGASALTSYSNDATSAPPRSRGAHRSAVTGPGNGEVAASAVRARGESAHDAATPPIRSRCSSYRTRSSK